MSIGFFVHSDVDFESIHHYETEGYEPIIVDPELFMFLPSNAMLVDWDLILRHDPSGVAFLHRYEEITTTSYFDWVELLFLHPNTRHAQQIRYEVNATALLSTFYERLRESPTTFNDPAKYRTLYQSAYLLGEFAEAERLVLALLRLPGGSDHVAILIAIAAAQGDAKRALELLNVLANQPYYSSLLKLALAETDPASLRRLLLRAGGDFVSEVASR